MNLWFLKLKNQKIKIKLIIVNNLNQTSFQVPKGVKETKKLKIVKRKKRNKSNKI
jgi:hypothetical protein